ncbi:MAG: hypothetical protein Q8Q62_10925 [Mesorhizobium sp.]|nr:hypothetical protein [Mesorhizobium sp.]
MRRVTSALVLTAMMAVSPGMGNAVRAQTAGPDPFLALDLNALQPSKGGCRLTFVVTNGLSTPIDRAAFEMALFNRSGVVDRLTVLDFKDLPAGKTKVSRFDLAGSACADIGRVLINDATDCKGAGTDRSACLGSLRTQSTSGVTFGR